MSYTPIVSWCHPFTIVAFFNNQTMNNSTNNWCWYVPFMLLEQTLTKWRCPLASRSNLAAHGHLGKKIYMEGIISYNWLHHDEHVSTFFHILSTEGVVGWKQNLPAQAPNNQTWHIPSALDLCRLYVEFTCPALWASALRRAWYTFYVGLKRQGTLQYFSAYCRFG